MLFASFHDSSDAGAGALTTRLYFQATVNPLEYYGLEIIDGAGADIAPEQLSDRDWLAIKSALLDAVAEQRRVLTLEGEWLSRFARTGRAV